MTMTTSKQLADLISKREWASVVAHLESHPSNASAKVQGKDNANNDNNNATNSITLLPLHLALRAMATFDVCMALITAYPAAVLAKEESTGMLPLHLACRYGAHPDVVNLILMHYPQAIDAKDDEGKLPTDYATKYKTYHNDEVKTVMVLRRSLQYCEVSKATKNRASQDFDDKLADAIKKHETNIASIKTRHKEEYDQLVQSKSQLQTELDEKNEQLADLREEIETLTEATDEARCTAEAERNDLQLDLDVEKEENAELRQQIVALKLEARREKAERQSSEEELRTAMSKATISLSKINAELRDELQKSHKTSVLRELEALSAASTVDNLTNRVQELEQTVSDREMELKLRDEKETKLIGRAQELKEIASYRASKLKSKDEEEEKLVGRVKELEELLSERDSEIKLKEEAEAILTDRIQELEEIVLDSASELKLKGDAEARLTDRVQELESKAEAEARLTDRVQELEETNAENEAKLIRRIKLLEGMVQTAKSSIQLLESQNKTLTKGLEDKKTKNKRSAVANAHSLPPRSSPRPKPKSKLATSSAVENKASKGSKSNDAHAEMDKLVRKASSTSLASSAVIKEMDGLDSVETLLVDNRSPASSQDEDENEELREAGPEEEFYGIAEPTTNVSSEPQDEKTKTRSLPFTVEIHKIQDKGKTKNITPRVDTRTIKHTEDNSAFGPINATAPMESVDFPPQEKSTCSFLPVPW